MPDMDQGIKRLVQTHPADLLALAMPGAEYLGPLQIDVAAEPQLLLDTLLRIRYHGVECAIDIEAEARPRPGIARRLYEYGARASIVTGLPVFSVVLWLDPGGAPPPSPYELRADDRVAATWNFVGVEVYNLRAEDIIGLGPVGVFPLVAFSADRADLGAIERATEIIKERAPEHEAQQLATTLVLFATRNLDANLLLQLLRRIFMNTEILESSELYQMIVAQTTERVERETSERTLREATVDVLRGRFGALPEDVVAAVGRQTVEDLHVVLSHAGTDTLDQLRSRLGL